MERSQFVLDEGYHLRFYDPDHGIDFITDTAGDWCLAFMRGPRCIYALKEMAREPVITVSYPDMVRYHYQPFEDIRVDVTFLVHSSRTAVQEITVSNVGRGPARLQVVPFLRNSDRAFQDVHLRPDQNAVVFTHEEFPDGWTLNHRLPYTHQVQDLLLLSPAPDRLGSYGCYREGPVQIPPLVDLGRKRVYLVWGRVHHRDGEPCRHTPVRSSFMVILDGDRRQILTENAPRWGSAARNVDEHGYYRVELGNFGNIQAGQTYTVYFRCGVSGQCAALSGTVSNPDSVDSARKDLTLGTCSFPRSPQGLRSELSGSGTELRLCWERADGKDVHDDKGTHNKDDTHRDTYNVYRCNYRQSGVYELVSENLSHALYTDKNIAPGAVYGYLVTAVDPQGRMSLPSEEANSIAESSFLADLRYPGQIPADSEDYVRVIAAPKTLQLAPGAAQCLRIVRGMAPAGEDTSRMHSAVQRLLSENLDRYITANEQLYRRIPRIVFDDPDTEMLYWNAFTLLRQAMLPREGKCGYNYYVFSREPTWGWGHGGQVFHESLAMLAYALMDPESARDSQRIYSERQHPDGYINYRTGPYLDETIPTKGQLTSSAPWYAWINWEVYQIAPDRAFLQEMYASSAAFYRYITGHRDRDADGLCEWGAHAVLESVRDARVAVWDQVGWPGEFEAMDMNVMLVQEAKALAAMAEELELNSEAQAWRLDARQRSERINQVMWDEATGFYYHVDLDDHDFTHSAADDLKRQEIIGFLPMWAGVASRNQAQRLVDALTDPNRFGRPFGVPSLSADDPYYNPHGYWNGPVWVEWAYLVQRGLASYGYRQEARDLAQRVTAGMIERLKEDHVFWEFYSPDDPWGGYHQTYIWAGLVSRMLLDARR